MSRGGNGVEMGQRVEGWILISRVRGLLLVGKILGGFCDGWGEDDRAKAR